MMQDIFRVLSSEQRLKILEILGRDGSVCYCELEDELGKDRSVIYRHFMKLEKAGLIQTRKEGKKLKGRIKAPEKLEKFLKLAERLENES